MMLVAQTGKYLYDLYSSIFCSYFFKTLLGSLNRLAKHACNMLCTAMLQSVVLKWHCVRSRPGLNELNINFI